MMHMSCNITTYKIKYYYCHFTALCLALPGWAGTNRKIHPFTPILIITHTHTHTAILQLYGLCPGQSGWASTRRNIHPLTPIVVINRPLYLILIVNHSLSAFSIYYDPRHPPCSPCSIYVHDSHFAQPLSKSFLVNLLGWHPPLYTPYISSPIHYLLFATHAHTNATCFV